MKNTEKEIIERFQKLDFDKDGFKQSKIFDKVTKQANKKSAFTPKFALVGTLCVVMLAVAGVIRHNNTERPYYKHQPPPQVETIAAQNAQPLAEAPAMLVDAVEVREVRREAVQSTAAAARKGRAGVSYDSFAAPEKANRAAFSAGGAGGNYMAARQSIAYIPAPNIMYDYNSMQDESYAKFGENTFRSAATDPLSTFSADVDTASYNIVKRNILAGQSFSRDAVRIEEFINYFNYDYPQPTGKDPVSMSFEYADSPWNKGLKVVKIGIKAKDIEKSALPPSNLVFLIDVSGSMEAANRLPLVKKSLGLLVNELRPQDKVSIVTYANGVNEVISGVKGSDKRTIIDAIEGLRAAGGTNGSSGLALAYDVAKKNFIRKGSNRVILATDGDFNIGPRSHSELENQITAARETGVYLSVLGYGMGNYKDSMVQTLANKGNGNYAYINDLAEANKVLVKEFGATLFTVAKDIKLQVEFNPSAVSAYRLIGYEKRRLENQDFNDDAKDAGDLGAGHAVTVFYEIIPAGVKSDFLPQADELKYSQKTGADNSGEVLTLKLRYKEPDGDTSKLMEKTLKEESFTAFKNASNDMRFAASVIQFGQIAKDSPFKGAMTIDEVIETAKKAKGQDDNGYRAEFVKMAEMYKLIK